MNKKWPIVLIEDEAECRTSYCTILDLEGYGNVLSCDDSTKALQMIEREGALVILLDLMMPKLSGYELLPRLIERYPAVPVVVITGTDDTDTIVRCMKDGAYDYLVKPVNKNRLLTTVQQAIRFRELNAELDMLRDTLVPGELKHPECFRHIMTVDPAMKMLFRYAENIAPSFAPLLIEGETGTGKELFARAVHSVSGRSGPFVAVNVAGLDDMMFADTLFGHVRGAYTGADNLRKGIIEQAARGTILLDEIGDLSHVSQLKLLRLLQENEYFRLGADQPSYSDARIIVATNRSLDQLQQSGVFRNDLYYRLCTHRIHIPPLRERKQDLPLLINHYFKYFAHQQGRSVPVVPDEVYTLLSNYQFPGNIRELEGMLYDVLMRHPQGKLSLVPIREYIRTVPCGNGGARDEILDENMFTGLSVLPCMKMMKESLMLEALERAGGNQSQAADLIGISQQTVSKFLQAYGKDS